MQPSRPVPVGLLAFLGSAGLFVVQAAPSVGLRDAGELTTSAFLVDVPHPTGFVADMVLFRLAMLVPVGDLAFRANVLVAVTMALACAVAAKLAHRLVQPAREPFAVALSLATAFSLALSPTVLRAGTAVEVYALSLLVSLAAIGLIVRAALPLGETADPSTFSRGALRRTSAALLGATVLVHTGARPAALLACVLAFAWTAPRPLRARTLVAGAAVLLAAMLPVLYLPLAARAHRFVNWGDPSNAARLLAHLTAARIRSAFAYRMFVAWRVPEDLVAVGSILWADLGPLVVGLGVVGAFFGARHRAARWIVVLALVDMAYATLVNPMGVADRQTLFVAQSAIVTLAALAVGHLGRVRNGSVLGIALAIAIAVLAVVRVPWSFAGRASGWTSSELLGGALGSVPPRTLVLAESDDLSGAALYAQRVEGERPDVVVLPRQHLADPSTWRRLRWRALGVVTPPTFATDADLRLERLRGLVVALGSQLRWEPGETTDERLAGVVLGSAETPVLAAIGTPVTAVDLRADTWLSRRAAWGYDAQHLAATVLDGAGRRVARADMAAASVLWSEALRHDPDDATACTNLGVAASAVGDFAAAIAWTERAVQDDPERVTAWRNLARYRAALGDRRGAQSAFEQAERRSAH